MTDIAPASPRHQKNMYMRQNKVLKDKVESLELEVLHYKEQIDKLTLGDVPQIVKNWMNEYSLPWEIFWCFEHEKWIAELDNLFPYHMENCRCDKCES
ncbi:hypothetical protein HWV00_21020 (plasmid) [Moritella sp. 24]|uniref:hypothetical protein n=1 Tax=Moritella sp. 24 TaxID=2746230 RepID=UPI001BA5FDC7|nr:hypothetical protein [Moritella sp. 24]QUM78757.1 hypothetical protein HWV00_21020 [Moritella sp. 24]